LPCGLILLHKITIFTNCETIYFFGDQQLSINCINPPDYTGTWMSPA
jgi:hypothetical protein